MDVLIQKKSMGNGYGGSQILVSPMTNYSKFPVISINSMTDVWIILGRQDWGNEVLFNRYTVGGQFLKNIILRVQIFIKEITGIIPIKLLCDNDSDGP